MILMELADFVALVIGALCVIPIIIYIAANQKEKVLEWLKYAVSEAEKQLGAGTGQLKLRLVYDWFYERFPIIAAVVPFKVFSAWVDTALDTMKEWLKVGNKIGDYITETGVK